LLPLAIWVSYPTRRCYKIASHGFTLWQWLSLLFWLAFLLGGLQAGWLENYVALDKIDAPPNPTISSRAIALTYAVGELLPAPKEIFD